MIKLKAKRALLKGAVTRILTFISTGGLGQTVADCCQERLDEV